MKKNNLLFLLIITLSSFSFTLKAQNNYQMVLDPKQKSLVAIASAAGKGDLRVLKKVLINGLEEGLTVNEIKELLVQVYAYAGFPRSIRGLQTFMTLLDERKDVGINDNVGHEASPIVDSRSKYERGKIILEQLTGVQEKVCKTGYAAFAPIIDVFLKEHLFADIFERDILTFRERELITVVVLSGVGGVEPMLKSHLNLCLNVGLTPSQLEQFTIIIKKTIGKQLAQSAKTVLDDVLKSRQQ